MTGLCGEGNNSEIRTLKIVSVGGLSEARAMILISASGKNSAWESGDFI